VIDEQHRVNQIVGGCCELVEDDAREFIRVRVAQPRRYDVLLAVVADRQPQECNVFHPTALGHECGKLVGIREQHLRVQPRIILLQVGHEHRRIEARREQDWKNIKMPTTFPVVILEVDSRRDDCVNVLHGRVVRLSPRCMGCIADQRWRRERPERNPALAAAGRLGNLKLSLRDLLELRRQG